MIRQTQAERAARTPAQRKRDAAKSRLIREMVKPASVLFAEELETVKQGGDQR